MKLALNTLEEVIEPYIVEVITEFHVQNQQLVSYSVSTCLLEFQGKEIGYR